ncbi:MAG: hypothetical protein IPL61_02800 [Myxococcales bacterium]|nr:hypothetical protein [Myxococcales bacterium]
MSNFDTIDHAALTSITGGVTAEGSLTIPAGSGTLKVDTATPANPQASDPNAYIRCLDLVGKQAGMMESPANVANRQQALCNPLLKQ